MRFFSLLSRPLSWLYALILRIRHWLYDRGFLLSESFDQPIIKIGNLSLGGTGKTPMTIFIAEWLSRNHKIYVLSRGYRGRYRDVVEVNKDSKADEVGDEPLLIKTKLDKARVFVSRDRVVGIRHINTIDSGRKVIILDDSLQHRRLADGFQILLTDSSSIFCKDHLLPSGRLRDLKSRACKANLIVVTKLKSLTEDITRIDGAIKEYSLAPIFHSTFREGQIQDYRSHQNLIINEKVVVVSAIANTSSLYRMIEAKSAIIKKWAYRDHYKYSETDLNEWLDYCEKQEITQIITTEKDAVKMIHFEEKLRLAKVRILVLPIQIALSDRQQAEFFVQIENYINQYKN